MGANENVNRNMVKAFRTMKMIIINSSNNEDQRKRSKQSKMSLTSYTCLVQTNGLWCLFLSLAMFLFRRSRVALFCIVLHPCPLIDTQCFILFYFFEIQVINAKAKMRISIPTSALPCLNALFFRLLLLSTSHDFDPAEHCNISTTTKSPKHNQNI